MPSVSNSASAPVPGDVEPGGRDRDPIGVSGPADALAAIGRLRTALNAVQLTAVYREQIGRELEAVEQELSSPAPDHGRVLQGLERVTAVLRATGSLAAAGEPLAGPIGAIAAWLGPIGAELARAVR